MGEQREGQPPTPKDLPLLGGMLCLDFANTVDWRGTDHRRDWLQTYEDLVAWSVHAKAVTPALARRLRKRAALEPKRAKAVLARGHALREALYDVGSATAGGKGPASKEALDALNREMFRIMAPTQLRPGDDLMVREWAGDTDALERILWPMAWSAFDLLTGPGLDRLRECADADCRWLFVDRSRNRSRRWCAMSDCGNLTKVRRYRQRKG